MNPVSIILIAVGVVGSELFVQVVSIGITYNTEAGNFLRAVVDFQLLLLVKNEEEWLSKKETNEKFCLMM